MKLSPKQIGIILFGLATAGLHIYAAIALYPPGQPDILFLLNGLGYLGLLGAYFLPIPLFQERHKLVWRGFVGYTLLTIVLFFVMGNLSFATPDSIVGYSAKAVEVLLLVCLWGDKS